MGLGFRSKEGRARGIMNPIPIRVRKFLSVSYSFGIDTFIYSRSSLETIPDNRPKWGNCIPVCRPKQGKNPTRWGGTYLYNLHKWVPPRDSLKWRIFHTCNWLTETYCFETESDLIVLDRPHTARVPSFSRLDLAEFFPITEHDRVQL